MRLADTANNWAPRLLSILRIVTALLLFEHGLSKLLHFPPSDMNPPPGSLFWIAGCFELVGGGLLTIGLFSRAIAFILAGEMAIAYWMVHAPMSFFPLLNHGEGAILYCFIFLYLAAAGPGPWSVDAALSRRGV